jgi:hypothetical protein
MQGLAADDFMDPGAVFQVGVAPARIDLLSHIDGVTFDEAWKQRGKVVLEGIAASIISAEHLLQNKLHMGRTRDLADVEAIRSSIEQSRKSQPES